MIKKIVSSLITTKNKFYSISFLLYTPKRENRTRMFFFSLQRTNILVTLHPKKIGEWTGQTISMYLSNLPSLSLSPRAECVTKSIFKWSTTGLNLYFSFSQTGCDSKVKEHSPPNCLFIVGGILFGSILFSEVLAPCEMQTAVSRFWTRVAKSMS